MLQMSLPMLLINLMNPCWIKVLLLLFYFKILLALNFWITVFTVIYSWASNHHIRVISEGSCDTEDWSNDAGNTALITGINYILINVYTVFWFSLWEHKRHISETINNRNDSKHLMCVYLHNYILGTNLYLKKSPKTSH